jgi:hemoglobin
MALVTVVTGALLVMAIGDVVRTLRAEPPGPPARHRKEQIVTHPRQDSMYDRVAGDVGVRTLVDRFYNLVLGDALLLPYFAGTDMSKLKRHFALVVSQVLGGPVFVQDPAGALRQAHARLDISAHAYWRTISYLIEVMDSMGVPTDVVEHVFATVWALRDEVIKGD